MQDSLEDRIHKAGHQKEFGAAVKKFRTSRKTNTDQSIFYDKLCDLGAGPEEADEFVSLFMEDSYD